MLLLILVASLFAGWITPVDPNRQDRPAETKLMAPSAQHLFGTDQFGRDVFSRVLYGGRISLLISLVVVVLALGIGCAYGALAGLAGGWLDDLLMRIVDLFLSFPTIFLILTLTALFGSNLIVLIFVLAVTSWMDIARLVRAEVHSLKLRPFVLRAKSAGLPPRRIFIYHFLPNLFSMIFAVAIMRMADIILVESALSFIGLGVQPPMASWGSIIGDGKSVLAAAWWVSFFPGLVVVLTILSLYLMGNDLKEGRV